jgi:hypothetical protein
MTETAESQRAIAFRAPRSALNWAGDLARAVLIAAAFGMFGAAVFLPAGSSAADPLVTATTRLVLGIVCITMAMLLAGFSRPPLIRGDRVRFPMLPPRQLIRWRGTTVPMSAIEGIVDVRKAGVLHHQRVVLVGGYRLSWPIDSQAMSDFAVVLVKRFRMQDAHMGDGRIAVIDE